LLREKSETQSKRDATRHSSFPIRFSKKRWYVWCTCVTEQSASNIYYSLNFTSNNLFMELLRVIFRFLLQNFAAGGGWIEYSIV
jgi:hypothetical protein